MKAKKANQLSKREQRQAAQEHAWRIIGGAFRNTVSRELAKQQSDNQKPEPPTIDV